MASLTTDTFRHANGATTVSTAAVINTAAANNVGIAFGFNFLSGGGADYSTAVWEPEGSGGPADVLSLIGTDQEHTDTGWGAFIAAASGLTVESTHVDRRMRTVWASNPTRGLHYWATYENATLPTGSEVDWNEITGGNISDTCPFTPAASDVVIAIGSGYNVAQDSSIGSGTTAGYTSRVNSRDSGDRTWLGVLEWTGITSAPTAAWDNTDSAYSGWILWVWIKNASGAPDAPTGLGGSAGGPNSIDLTWTDNASDEDNFRLEQSETGAFSGEETLVDGNIAANTVAYEVTGLDPSTEYFYRIRAENASGDSAWNTSAGITTDAAAGPTAPVLGAIQSADDDSARIAVTSAGTGTGTITHQLHKSTTQGFTPTWGGGTLDSSYGATPTEVTATGLTGDETWYFKLMVDDDVGNATSNEASVTTAPDRPTGIAFSEETPNSIRITLSGGSVGTETQRIYRDDVQIADIEAPRDYYDDAGLDAATTYDYDARAVGPVYLSGRISGQGTTTGSPPALNRRRHAMDLRDRRYGEATTLAKAVFDLQGQHLVTTPFVAGDIKVSKDGGAFANIGSLPTVVGDMLRISLTATEMQAAEVVVVGSDQDGPAWADFTITIQTEGNASAQWARDRDLLALEASLSPLALEASLSPLALEASLAPLALEASLAPLSLLDVATSEAATPAEVQTKIEEALTTYDLSEITAVPGAAVTVAEALSALKILMFNKMTATNSLLTVFAADGVTPIWTRDLSDDGTTFTPAPAVDS